VVCDQTEGSCFTSSAASSQSQIGTNRFNNNTGGGGRPGDHEQQTGQSQRSSVGTVCAEMGKEAADRSSTEKNIRAEVNNGESREEEEKPNYVRHHNGSHTTTKPRAAAPLETAEVKREQHNKPI